MLNWQTLKSSSPAAYEQFQEWLISCYEYRTDTLIRVRTSQLAPLLYEFFEKRGVIVNVMGCMWGKTAEYSYELQQDGVLNGILGYGYSSRQEAENAAFLHAFTLINQQQAA